MPASSDNADTTRDQRDEISLELARQWWKTLMANAAALVEDAAALAEHQSPGRAQALVVLAMEELAKARWLHEEVAEYEWTAPLGLYGMTPRPAGSIAVPEGLRTARRPHAEKLQVAEQSHPASPDSGTLLGDTSTTVFPIWRRFEATARQRNLDQQAGFCVDRSGTSPLHVPSGEVEADIQRAAQVIQMHLIKDHTRQQYAPDPSMIDSAEDHSHAMTFAQSRRL